MIKNTLQKLKKLSLLKKGILILLVFVAIWYFFIRTSANGEIEYKWANAELGTITQVVSESGQVMSANTSLNSTINGIVTNVYVKNGDPVRIGTPLYAVNSSATPTERASAYASYLGAKNNLESAQSKLYSLQSTAFNVNQKFINDAVERELATDDPTYIQQYADWKAAEEAYIDQDLSIQQARSALSSAWLNYQATTSGSVTATAVGTIANLAIAIGQPVTTDSTTLLIVTQAQPYVQITVTESDVTKITPGQSATITFDALSSTQLSGQVARVDSIGTDNSGVITYNVYILLDSQDTPISSGMSADVDITTQQADNVLIVPNTAIKPYQGAKAVQIQDPTTSQIIYQPVTTGIMSATHTQILTGIEAGQPVITSNSTDESTSGSGGGLFGGRPRS